MSNVFKINLFTYIKDYTQKAEYQKYCLENNILGWGWNRAPNAKEVKDINEYQTDYGKNKSLSTACNRISIMEKDDYCWTKCNGDWYLGKVSGNDFNFRIPAPSYEKFGMYRNCVWKKIEDINLVPGIVASYSINDKTIKLISNMQNFYKYCEVLYTDKIISNLHLDFWELSHYEDLEDIVGLYLQKAENYLIFPSTNKQSTKDYEYKLINEKTKKQAIIQTKNNAEISLEKFEKNGKYEKLNVFLFQVKERNDNWGGNTEDWEMGLKKENGRIKIFDKDKLKDWAFKNRDIMPERIKIYIDLSK